MPASIWSSYNPASHIINATIAVVAAVEKMHSARSLMQVAEMKEAFRAIGEAITKWEDEECVMSVSHNLPIDQQYADAYTSWLRRSRRSWESLDGGMTYLESSYAVDKHTLARINRLRSHWESLLGVASFSHYQRQAGHSEGTQWSSDGPST